MFDLAWFWKLDPAVVMSLPLDRFLMYEAHAMRIHEQVQGEEG